MKVVFIHLYPDASGSTHVLLNLAKSTKALNKKFLVITGSKVLPDIFELFSAERYFYLYSLHPHPIAKLFSYILSQIHLFVLLLVLKLPSGSIIYINTLLPFGAALYAKVFNKKLIVHIHELSLKPKFLNIFLKFVAKNTANKLIFVSRAHLDLSEINHPSRVVLYNSLPVEYQTKALASEYKHVIDDKFNVLMLASLRKYKGIYELCQICLRLQHTRSIKFTLLANEDVSTIKKIEDKFDCMPSNLNIQPRSLNTHKYYQETSLVINLSRPDLWIETFALTVLEAFAHGIPVIAPPVGGPTELVTESVDGFLIDCRDVAAISSKIFELSQDKSLCMLLSSNARKKYLKFNNSIFQKNLSKIIGDI